MLRRSVDLNRQDSPKNHTPTTKKHSRAAFPSRSPAKNQILSTALPSTNHRHQQPHPRSHKSPSATGSTLCFFTRRRSNSFLATHGGNLCIRDYRSAALSQPYRSSLHDISNSSNSVSVFDPIATLSFRFRGHVRSVKARPSTNQNKWHSGPCRSRS